MNNQIYIVGEDNIQKLNSLEQGGISILQIVNPLITAILWAKLGMMVTQWMAVLVSIIGVSLLPQVKYHNMLKMADVMALPNLKTVWHDIFQRSTVRKIFLLETCVGIFLVSEVVALAYIIVTNNYASVSFLGMIQGLIGIGSILGAALAYAKHVYTPLKVLKYTTLAIGILYSIQGLAFTLPIKSLVIASIIILNLLISLINTFTAPISYTVLQTSLSDNTRADVLTWYYTAQECVYPLGALLVSILMPIISPANLYLSYGLSIISIVLLVMGRLKNP
ncbi:hypothetical protein JOC59_001547 [Weissella beninensis]|uniref:MFS transporter n=2 Tax=Periweissella beninensis TaxID=504936 RepID=A0ABT0VH15_9LACO|nr:hypothetical protein [Periweissella beninensis]MBM7544816.1 hypothetical protein [Periweissella beninensis]MCM2437085.1 hypothetical protein [Periweissella beninensis]